MHPAHGLAEGGKDYTIQATFRYTGHVHSYGDWKFDKDNHWKECTAGDDIIAKAAHTPGGWVVDQPATETETGSQHQECTVCKYVMKTEAIDPIGVKYTRRTLTDPDTGIQVSGLFSSDAALAVKKKDVLHEKGTCPACGRHPCPAGERES